MNIKTLVIVVGAIFLVYFGVGEFHFWNKGVPAQTATSTDVVATSTTGTPASTLEYRNTTYGFVVPLPQSWKGFTVNESTKDGYKQVNIVHPLSTKENPRMDVPILVVPIATWNTWYPPGHPEDGQHPFAAPVPATERARNNAYVFATAPRYNFSYLPGFEEVDLIVQKVTAFNITSPLVAYPRNLKISGFEIVDGKAKVTILDRCIKNGTKCDYDKPDTQLYNPYSSGWTTKDGLVSDGYAVGIYMYDVQDFEGFINSAKYLILVGKDGKWRYDYLDLPCQGDGDCGYTFFSDIEDSSEGKIIKLGNSASYGNQDRRPVHNETVNLDKFLASKKSHFLINGY